MPTLTTLTRDYHDRVYRFGIRVCRDRADADDAVQEAFIKLGRREDVQRDRSVLSWLMSVVRNACRRMFTRQRKQLVAPNEPEEVASPEVLLARWQLVERVRAAIAALEPAYREVLVLRDLEGLSGEEVATSLGISLAAVKSRLHRARAMVREQLQ